MKPLATLALFGAVALSAILNTACGGGNAPSLTKVEASKTVTVLRADKSENLDPQATESGGDVTVLLQMYETLVRPSVGTPKVVWEPGLATSWTSNDDKSEYTFVIREGVTFHDGSKLDAAAVKKSLARLVDEDAPSKPVERPYRKGFFGDVTGIKVDGNAVTITLKGPNPRFLSNIGIHPAMIVSPKAIDHMATITNPAERSSWLTSHPAGTGPYTISSGGDYKESGANLTLTSFSGYWDGAPKIERVVFQTQAEVRQRTQRLIAGDIQFTDNLDPGDWADLESNKDVTLHTWQGMNLCYLAMNVPAENGHVTANRNVREAIALAINRDPMVAKFSGKAVSQHVLLPPPSLGFPKGYKPPTDTVPREEAIARARTLIKEAEAEGAKLELLMPDVARPYLLYPDEIANLIQQQLKEVGLEVTLAKSPMSEITGRVKSGKFALVLLGWMGDSGEPDNFWRPLLGGSDGKPAPLNAARFYNEEVMARMDAAGVETDETRRQKSYEDLEKWVFETFRPMVPLLSAQRSLAWRSNLTGVLVDTTGQYHFHKASIEE